MDKAKSIQLEKALKGKNFNGYNVLSLVNNGKSAAVFKAEKQNKFFALKIFDNELVERFGHEIQIKRIEQEISLKNHGIKGLVEIYEGGKTEINDKEYFYIVMEFITGQNLKEFIQSEEYSEDFILKVLQTLVKTSEDLLQKGIAHRDIKPENIMVDGNHDIILMDLGVLKLVGLKSFNDDEEKAFVGTLRYAPPEFLTRMEEDSLNGWRAVNLYQIGATLHDLVMKEELFIEKIPYSNLVIAIKDDSPKVSNAAFSFYLLQLIRDMMTKNSQTRLKIVSQEKIDTVLKNAERVNDSFEDEVEHILKLRLGRIANFDEIKNLNRTKSEIRIKQIEVGKNIAKLIDSCFEIIKTKGVYTKYSKSIPFYFTGDEHSEVKIQNFIYELQGDEEIGFPANLWLFFRIANDENSYTEINAIALFPGSEITLAQLSPSVIIKRYILSTEQLNGGIKMSYHNIKSINIFEGVIEIDDNLQTVIGAQILKIIFKALKSVSFYIEEKVQIQKQMASSKAPIVINQAPLKTIKVDDLKE